MQTTEVKNSKVLETAESKGILSTPLNTTSEKSNEERVTLGPLSKDLSIHLLNLAKKVTENEITPKTVSAACQCAAELYKIMKLNWEMKGK